MGGGANSRDGDETKARPYRPGPDRRPGEIPCLVVLDGESRGRVVPLLVGTSHIGRAPTAHLQLHDEGISRTHAAVELSRDGIVTIVDKASTNGTFVNGARVERAAVRDGDRIQIGSSVTLRFGYRMREELPERPTAAPSPIEPPLSERELEVARLAARGLRNAEIGARLHISAGTVKSHLRNIYERLGVHSRIALSRWLAERGLADDP